MFERVEMTAEALEEVDRRGEAAKTVLAECPAQDLPQADAFITLRGRDGERVRNRFEDPVKPFRLDPAEDATPEEQVANRADRFRRVDAGDDIVEEIAAGGQPAFCQVEEPAIVKLLQQIVGGEQSLGVLVRRATELGTE